MRSVARLSQGSFRAVRGRPAAGWGVLVLLAALGLPAPARGLDPRKLLTQFGHDTWTREKGLPTSGVEVLAQTPDGYLWIGTQEGLVRFDGLRFTVYNRRTAPALLHAGIRALEPRRAGGLWIGTWRGLYRLEGERMTAVTVVADDPLVVIDDLHEAADGTLWVATQGYGVARLVAGRPARFFTAKDGLPNDVVWAVQGDRAGNLWIGTRRGLARLRGGSLESLGKAAGLPDSSFACFHLARDGSLWIGTSDGLLHYANGAFRAYGRADGLGDSLIDAVWEDRHGSLWVGSRDGLWRRSGGKFSRYGMEEGLLDNVVRALWEDAEGSLWVGTWGGGLERFRDGRFLPYGKPEGLADDSVNSVYQDRTGALWFGTRLGLTRMQDGRFRTWTKQDGLYVSFITALAEDRRGALWVGTAAGLNRLEGERIFRFRPDDDRFYHYISTVHEDRQGRLWIGSPNESLYFLRNGKVTAITTADGIDNINTAAIVDSHDGGLWISTIGGGVAHYKDGTFTNYGPRQGLNENVVYAPVVEDADGTVWIATYGGGISRLKGGRLTAITSRQGLFDDTLIQLVDDGLGFLWLGASSGFSRVAKADLHAVADGRARTFLAAVYGTSDGMRTSEATGGVQPVSLRGADGRIWFATARGAVVVDPRHLPLRSTSPPVRIESLQVDGARMEPAKRVSIPAGSRRLEVAFTVPVLLAADQVRFRTRLDGFDRDWIDLGGTRSVTYTNLPPGDYRLRVQAARANGSWGDRETSLDLAFAPRFYQTPWFAALSVLAIALASWLAYRFQMRQVRLRYEGVLAERARIAGELHDTLAQNLAGLALQIESTDQTLAEDTTAARHHVQRARDLVRESLEASRRSVWNLRAEKDGNGLAEALTRLGEPFAGVDGSHVAVTVAGREQPLPAEVESHLLRIGQEAVTNAIRHGKAEHVQIQLKFEDERVLLLVEDNGMGFSLEDLPRQSAGHFGLLGMRERVRQLRGSLSVDSRPGAGTRVRVEVPLGGVS